MGRHPFDLLMELHTEFIQLDCAALHLARDEYPQISVRDYLSKLDDLARDVMALRPGVDAAVRYEALKRVLVDRHGFTGNRDDYYDADNSYLNRVIDERIGIPISLSIVWIEVGRRLNWPIGGVALPGHFVVRLDDPQQYVIADPFNDGRTLSLQQCRKIVERSGESDEMFDASMLDPVDTRTILTRMLLNLRGVYQATGDMLRLGRTLERLAVIDDRNAKHLQELADLRFRQGDVRGAYTLLATYLEVSPNADDSRIVQQSMQRLHAAMRTLN